MGEWEPLICQPGNYCPPGGKDSIQCPAGSFCPLGSYQPIPCGPVSRCPAGSNKSQEFQLLVLMLLVDTFFIGIVIWYRIKARRLKSHVSNTEDMVDRFSRAFGLQGKKKRSPGAYQSLSDDSIALEPRIQTVHRTNTGGFQAMMDNYHAFTDDDSDDGNEKPSTELQAFVQSMAKCVETGSFGLSFEFSDLKYQPKKSLRPVLSEVSGVIPRGSFVGIMGASGAGKCRYKHSRRCQ